MKIKLSVAPAKKTITIKLKDFGISREDWDWLSDDQKEAEVRMFVEEMEDQPYWNIDSID